MGGRIKPMNDIEILREMLVCNDDVQVPLHPGQGGPSSVELEDIQANTTVKITGLPDDSIVIRAESFKAPCCFFKGSQGERRRADFVIVSDNGNRKRWIICIEVQKGAPKNKERSRFFLLDIFNPFQPIIPKSNPVIMRVCLNPKLKKNVR